VHRSNLSLIETTQNGTWLLAIGMPFAPAVPFGSDLNNHIFTSGSLIPFGKVFELASGVTSQLNSSVWRMAGHPDHGFRVVSLKAISRSRQGNRSAVSLRAPVTRIIRASIWPLSRPPQSRIRRVGDPRLGGTLLFHCINVLLALSRFSELVVRLLMTHSTCTFVHSHCNCLRPFPLFEW
jgi:hypothetical protein